MMVVANGHAIRLAAVGTAARARDPWWKFWRVGGDARIRPGHLLLALATGPRGVGYHALIACGVEPGELGTAIERVLPPCAREVYLPGCKLPADEAAQEVIAAARAASLEMGHHWIGTEHVLLGLLARGGASVRETLAAGGITEERVRAFLVNNMKAASASPQV